MDCKRICVSALAALAALVPLRAGGGDSKWRFGAQAGLAAPMGPISRIASTGFDLSLFAEYRLSEKTAESFSVGCTMMGGKDFGFEAIGGDVVYDATLNFRTSCVDAMWNVYYYVFDTNGRGLYLTHGFGAGFCSFTPESGAGTTAFTGSLAAGLGYNFGRNMGVEAGYALTTARHDFSLLQGPFRDVEVSRNVQSFKLGVRCRL